MTGLFRSILALLSALALGAASPAGQTYIVDATQSGLSAKVGFLAIGKRTAGFPEVSGQVRLDRTMPEDIDLDVTVNARALTAPDELTLKRLKGEKFFWVEKYPTVRFVGSKMELDTPMSGTVDGTLTARGISQPVTLELTFDKPPQDVLPGEAITLTGKTRINRRDFGMKSYSLIVGKWVNIELKARLVPQA